MIVAIKVMQQIGWVMIAVGIVLAAWFVSGLAHPVSAQVPSTLASYNSHDRWVVTGFVVSMAGAAILLVSEALRRSQRSQRSPQSTVSVD